MLLLLWSLFMISSWVAEKNFFYDLQCWSQILAPRLCKAIGFHFKLEFINLSIQYTVLHSQHGMLPFNVQHLWINIVRRTNFAIRRYNSLSLSDIKIHLKQQKNYFEIQMASFKFCPTTCSVVESFEYNTRINSLKFCY